MNYKSLSLFFVLTSIIGFQFINPAFAQTIRNWQIIVPAQLQNEEAIKVALTDLQTFGKEIGINFQVTDDTKAIKGPAIVVGDAAINETTAKLSRKNDLTLQGVEDPQGYEIITSNTKHGKVMVIAGGSLIGNVYGLYWLWDRMRVYRTMPDINVIRNPALKTRMSLAWGRRAFGGGSKETMQQALRDANVDLPIVFPIHPRTQKNIDLLGLRDRVASISNLRLVDPIGYLDFLKLNANARLILTDSGGLQEEATILRVPVLD